MVNAFACLSAASLALCLLASISQAEERGAGARRQPKAVEGMI